MSTTGRISISRLILITIISILFITVGASKVSAASAGSKITLVRGNSATLKVGSADKVTWKSSNKSVATVSQKGKVKAVNAGKAVITAKAGKKNYSCQVTVKNPDAYGSARSGNTAAINTSTAGMSKAEAKVFKTLIGLRKKYPEGKKWTNKDYYKWNGGVYRGGYGCAAFAFLLSDAAFGKASSSIHKSAKKIRIGDILRVDKNTHSVIVLRVEKDGVVVAEGNYNSSIHWGRKITHKELAKSLDYVMTRYED